MRIVIFLVFKPPFPSAKVSATGVSNGSRKLTNVPYSVLVIIPKQRGLTARQKLGNQPMTVMRGEKSLSANPKVVRGRRSQKKRKGRNCPLELFLLLSFLWESWSLSINRLLFFC